MQKFVERIIAWSLHNHLVVLFLTELMAAVGVVCYLNTPVEAYPDVTNARAVVITQWPGRGAEEVEKFVTVPVMAQLNTIPRKSVVRSATHSSGDSFPSGFRARPSGSRSAWDSSSCSASCP